MTDLAVHAQLDRDRGTVMVANRSDGAPVAGAAVALTSCAGDTLATAATDSAGIAELAGMGAAEARARSACEQSSWRILQVTTANDYDAVNVPLSVDPSALVGALPAAIVVPDRLVYRRGDSIRARVIVRRPAPDSIRLVVVGSERGGSWRAPVALDTLVPLSRAGTAELEYAVGPRLQSSIHQMGVLVSRLGRWRQVADAVFWVTDEAPPQVFLSLIPDRRWGARGDSVAVSVAAWDRQGAAVAGVVDVRWWGSRLNPYAVIPVPPGFTTSEVRKPGRDHSAEASGGRSSVQLDVAGKGRFILPLPERAPAWPWRMTVQATMPSAAVPAHAGHATVDVYPAAFNLAMRIRPDEVGAHPDGRDSIDVIALRLDGTPMPGVRIDGLLAGRKWSVAPQERDSLPGPAGALVPDTLDRCSAITTDQPARCVLRRFPLGYATIFLGGTDNRGRYVEIERLAAYLGGSHGWREPAARRPILAADRATFLVGDTAVITIADPDGGGFAWLTAASEDRIDSHVLRLSGRRDAVRLVLGAGHAPRVTMTATVWSPERGGERVTHAVTSPPLDLEVRDPAETLTLTLQLPDRAAAASTRTVSISVDTTHQPLGATEILAWALDERLRAVDGQRLPDIVAALKRPPPARRVTVSALSHAAPVALVPVDPGHSIPPGTRDQDPDILRYGPWGERGARHLDDYPGLVFLGAARAGSDGRAILSVRLPAVAGRYHVVAVAVSPARLGGAEGTITVSPRQ